VQSGRSQCGLIILRTAIPISFDPHPPGTREEDRETLGWAQKTGGFLGRQRRAAVPSAKATSPPLAGVPAGPAGIPKGMDGPWQMPPPSRLPAGTRAHLLLLLPRQLHLLLLLLEEHRGHVLLLRVGRQELVPQRGQLVDHHE